MYLRILLLIFTVVTACRQDSKSEKEIEEIVGQIRKKFAPDHRESLFEIRATRNYDRITLVGESDSKEANAELVDQLRKITSRIEDKIILLPDSSIGLRPFALVTVSVANFRATPTHSAELVTQALMGTPVKLLKKNSGWYLAQTPDHYIAWVDGSGISPKTESEHQSWKSSKRLIVIDDYGFIKESTEKSAGNVSDYSMGMILENTGSEGSFLKVKLPDGRSGFILSDKCEDFIKFKSDSILLAENLIQIALHLKGRPYLWGGTSVVGMDCSGFIKMVYYMNGIILSRDASLQAKHGRELTIDPGFGDFQSGDLLFFGRKADTEKTARVTHVGMIVNGKEFIHESGNIVKINSLDSLAPEYSASRFKSFINARRIIGYVDGSGIQFIGKHPWY